MVVVGWTTGSTVACLVRRAVILEILGIIAVLPVHALHLNPFVDDDVPPIPGRLNHGQNAPMNRCRKRIPSFYQFPKVGIVDYGGCNLCAARIRIVRFSRVLQTVFESFGGISRLTQGELAKVLGSS